MDPALDGRSSGALWRRLDTGRERKGETADAADLGDHGVPDEFHPSLCRA